MKDYVFKKEYVKLPFTAYYNDKGYYHRISGPAIEFNNGDKEWYLDGLRLNCQTQEEFIRILKIKAFL
jgi:hypothetical protein